MKQQSPNSEIIQQLQALGWSFHGRCACSKPMEKLTKTGKDGVRYEIKLEVHKDRWQLHKWNEGVIASGGKNMLMNTVSNI